MWHTRAKAQQCASGWDTVAQGVDILLERAATGRVFIMALVLLSGIAQVGVQFT